MTTLNLNNNTMPQNTISCCSGHGECINNNLTGCSFNCTKCPNYEYCRNSSPADILLCHNGTCTHCDMDKYLHNVNHEFRDTNEACVVCFEEKGREMKFPSCTHWFCTDCMRKIILGKDEEEYNLSPVPCKTSSVSGTGKSKDHIDQQHPQQVHRTDVSLEFSQLLAVHLYLV